MTPRTTLATQLLAPGVEMAGSGTCAAGRIRRARLLWIALLVVPARPSAAPVLTPDVWAARRGRAPPAAASRPQEVKAQLLRRAWVHRRGRKAVELDAHLPPLALLQVPLGKHQRGGVAARWTRRRLWPHYCGSVWPTPSPTGNWRGERMWVNPPPRLLLEFVYFPQRSLALAPALICAPCERGLPLLKWHSRSGQAHDIRVNISIYT